MLEATRPRGRSRFPLAVVILAAGQGTRMRSSLPKIMHKVAGLPLVGHVLASARALKPERLVVVLAPKMEQVAAFVAPATVAVQEKARGTADAVAAALPALRGFDGDVVIAYGDQPLITAATLRRLRDCLYSQASGADTAGLAVLGFRPSDAGAYGRLILDDSGALTAIREHRDASSDERRIELCNSGVMVVRGDVLRRLLPKIESNNAKGEFYLTDLVALARADDIRCAVCEGDEDELHGVNSRAELANAETAMQRRLRAAAMEAGATLLIPEAVYFSFDTRLARDVVVGPNVFFGTGVSVGEGSEIHSFCHFLEAKVGRDTSIGPFARLRPGAVIGDGAHIGNFVEIKASTIAAGAKINHLSYVGDSSVGSGTNIGAGTITCNYDGFMKHRTTIGRNVFIGSDTALVAPVSVGDGAVIGAGSVVTKNVAKDALVIARGEERHFKGAAKRYRAKKSAELAKQKAKKKAASKAAKPLPAAAARAAVSAKSTTRPSSAKNLLMGRPSVSEKKLLAARGNLKVAIPTTRATIHRSRQARGSGLVGRPSAAPKNKAVGVAAVRAKNSKQARGSGLEGRPSVSEKKLLAARGNLKVAIPTTRAGLVGRPRASSKQKAVGVAATRRTGI